MCCFNLIIAKSLFTIKKMTQELVSAEYSAIRLVTEGYQVVAATKDENQWHTFAANKSAMVSLNENFSNERSHTFEKLLKWAKKNYATHIVAFTKVPYEEPIVLLELRG